MGGNKLNDIIAKFNKASTDYSDRIVEKPNTDKRENTMQKQASLRVFNQPINTKKLTTYQSSRNLSNTCADLTETEESSSSTTVNEDIGDYYYNYHMSRQKNEAFNDMFSKSGRPNQYVGGYTPAWLSQYRREQKAKMKLFGANGNDTSARKMIDLYNNSN